jgi:rifampicin phosphotransferase
MQEKDNLMSELIGRFGELPASLYPLAGGKGASLCRMFQSHFPVPDGLVILSTAFEDGELRPQAKTELLAQLTELRQGESAARFAVRSSALREDSAQSSYAGAFESVLNIQTDDEILAAVDRVSASANLERVQVYQHSMAERQAADSYPAPANSTTMAVVVQRMVQPEFAGVLFTADPISGSHQFLTGNYVHGLGDQLVSGEANAQNFQIKLPGGRYQGPGELKRYAVRLGRLCSRLEAEYGLPLDIEWAVAGEQVYLLQARPITTLQTINYATYEVNESLDHDYLWANNNVGEALPDVMTPFTWSIVRELDLETQKMQGYYLWSGNICGRVYSNISQIFSLTAGFGIPPRYIKKMIGNVFGILPNDAEMPIYPFSFGELLKDIIMRGKRSAQRIQYAQKHKEEYLRRTQPWCSEMLQRIEKTSDPQTLLQLWTAEIRPFVSQLWAVWLGGASDLTLVTLQNQLNKLVSVEDANHLLSNFRGENGLESLGPLVGIAKVIHGELTPQAYMELYGQRSPHEFEMSFPYPIEDPNFLQRQINEYQRAGVDVEALLEKQHAQFTQAKERFIQRYPSKRRWLEKSLAQISRAAQNRESLRAEFIKTFRVMRVFMCKVGAFAGIGEDAFFLYAFELPDLLNGSRTMLTDLPARKHNYQRYCELPPLPQFVRGRFDPFEWAKRPHRRLDYYAPNANLSLNDTQATLIKGFAGAAGIIEGTVRVLASYDEAPTFQAGEILVTTTTNIGWTPLFPKAAAIVTDIGAPLSHAAIVARELGIPAVVGCVSATTLLHTGDRVVVDGGQGIVQKL